MDKSLGLVRHYVDQVRALQVKHELGEDRESVIQKVDAVIAEAKEHISIWVDGTPEENWAYFSGQLKWAANHMPDDGTTSILMYAADAVKAQEPPERKRQS